MKIEVVRNVFTERSTISDLYVDGKRFGVVLEDKTRPETEYVNSETAIPYGTYNVVYRQSPTFKKLMPYIDIPNKAGRKSWSGVMFHAGNVPEHTRGCLLVGYQSKQSDKIELSTQAFSDFNKILWGAWQRGEKITVEVKTNLNTNPNDLLQVGILASVAIVTPLMIIFAK